LINIKTVKRGSLFFFLSVACLLSFFLGQKLDEKRPSSWVSFCFKPLFEVRNVRALDKVLHCDSPLAEAIRHVLMMHPMRSDSDSHSARATAILGGMLWLRRSRPSLGRLYRALPADQHPHGPDRAVAGLRDQTRWVRFICGAKGDQVRVFSRRGIDHSDRAPTIAEADGIPAPASPTD
jgi:hypothetical protein